MANWFLGDGEMTPIREFGIMPWKHKETNKRIVVYFKEDCYWGYKVIMSHSTSSSTGYKTKKQAMKDYAKSRWMYL